MDLQLYWRVLKRFRLLVLIGVMLGASLAILSYVRFEFTDGGIDVIHRQTETWQSQSRVFVTDRGFPWGRTNPEYVVDPKGEAPPFQSADAGRLSSLAVLYAELANGDPVKRLLRRRAIIATPSDPALVAIPGLVEVSSVPGPAFSGSPILPLINIRAIDTTPEGAIDLAKAATEALVTFIRTQQSAASIDPQERVLVQVISEADSARLIGTRGKTLPIVVFVSVMIAFIGLAFVLENVRPRFPKLAADDRDEVRALGVPQAERKKRVAE